MNLWIQVDATFRTHRKTLRIARSLGKDARRLPIWLWLYCVESARDGNLSKLSDADLAAVLDYSGNPAKLRAALVEAGFLTAEGIVVGWEERYTEKFKFYHDRAAKASAARWKRDDSPSTPSPPQEMTLDQIRREEISKHDLASLKDASSITPTPSAWPISLPSEKIDELSLATGKSPAQVRAMWPAFRDREAKFKADYSHPDAFAGFRDDLRKAKTLRPASADIEPQDWRETLERIHPGNLINVRGDSWSTVPESTRMQIENAPPPILESRFNKF